MCTQAVQVMMALGLTSKTQNKQWLGTKRVNQYVMLHLN